MLEIQQNGIFRDFSYNLSPKKERRDPVRLNASVNFDKIAVGF